MSFYCNRDRTGPGVIEGNPLSGLKNRVVITATRVLDAARQQTSTEKASLALVGVRPDVQPTTFISVTNTTVQSGVTNLTVTRLEERPCFARIQCNVHSPLTVTFLDQDSIQHTAQTQITERKDIIMYVPEASVFPFEITAVSSTSALQGTFSGNTLNCTTCTTTIMKVTAETDLLIPSYGYSHPPDAIHFEEQVCKQFFELPLYPSGK